MNINPQATALEATRKIWLNTRDYVFIILGTLLYSFAFTGFVLPYKIVIGGVTGVGTLVFFVTGIPVAISQYAINLVLLACAYKTVGRQFVLRTIFGATCMSVFVGILQPVMAYHFPNGIIENQPFMSTLIAGFLIGWALGLVFIHNGSTGGTDIVAAMVSKHSNVTIGRTMLYVDFCIISSSYLLFHEIETVMYGLVILFLISFMTDQIINTNRQAVQFFIISPHWVRIADAINTQAHRGCTVVDGLGWYSKHQIKMLIVVCRRIESVTIFRITKSIDPGAFITQGLVNGVYGQGFDEIKLKLHHEQAEKTKEAEAAAGDAANPQG